MTSPVRAPRSTPRSFPGVAVAKSRPDLRIVGAPRRRSRTGLLVGAATVVVFGALFAGAVAHSLLVSGQVHLDEVGVETRAQQERLELEQLDLAGLQSPGRIAREATHLGMVPAGQQNWISPVAGAGAVVTGAAPEPAPPPPTDAVTDTRGEAGDGTGSGARSDGAGDQPRDGSADQSPDRDGGGSELAAATTETATAEP